MHSLELVEILAAFGADRQQLTDRVTELEEAARHMQILGLDVAEIYSPPRVVELAQKMGLKPGFSMDLTS